LPLSPIPFVLRPADAIQYLLVLEARGASKNYAGLTTLAGGLHPYLPADVLSFLESILNSSGLAKEPTVTERPFPKAL
jgi:hypothetical protein